MYKNKSNCSDLAVNKATFILIYKETNSALFSRIQLNLIQFNLSDQIRSDHFKDASFSGVFRDYYKH